MKNSQALIDAMGCWPSFHDAYLLRAALAGDRCRVVVHVFEMTDEIDATGSFVLRRHHLVTIEMRGVLSCSLPASHEPDILDSISAQETGSTITVRFESVIDPDRSWQTVCREALITAVVPCDASGKAV